MGPDEKTVGLPLICEINYGVFWVAQADLDRGVEANVSQTIQRVSGEGLSPLRGKPSFNDRVVELWRKAADRAHYERIGDGQETHARLRRPVA